ncbi:MAG: polysaccharide biosynthesis protein [Phycisphaerae bacterium]|nr:polysaccharide biosynthesis protein [Phycisphaerae bacterium]
MPPTALLIGPPDALARLERQLDLLAERPITIGWVVTGDPDDVTAAPVVGHVRELEALVARRRPTLALISMPAVMSDLVRSLRTRLRRLQVPDRFMPTLEDQLAGIGPRAEIDIDLASLLDRSARVADPASVRSVVANRRVLITGAGGSIGSELARIVADHGPEHLLLMDRSENALFEIDRQIARRQPDVERLPVLHDVVDAAGTLRHCENHRPHLIIHAAAHKHVPMMERHPAAAVDNNVFGTMAIADAADAVGAERFVMISTDKAVNPASMMGATKRLAELYVQELNQRSATACSMVRFGNVLGSTGSVMEIWRRQVADGGPVTVTDPRMQRYFMTIPEAAALVLEAAALVDPAAPGGEVFLLDMGDPVAIIDMARRFVRQLGLEPRLPGEGDAAADAGVMRIVFSGTRPGEKLAEELAFDVECMQPTRHPEINVWQVPTPPRGFGRRLRETLGPGRRSADPAAVITAVRQLVPEMIRPAA